MSGKTTDALNEENFQTVSDLKLLGGNNLAHLKLPMRDELAIRNYLKPSEDADMRNGIRVKQGNGQRKVIFDSDCLSEDGSVHIMERPAANKKQRMDQFTGENSSSDSEGDNERLIETKHARDLPRPHL